MGQALDVIDFYFDFDNEENTSIPSNEANASEVADWLENFKGGKFQTSALKGAEGKDLYRTSKESLQASLGEELGKEFYDLFHKVPENQAGRKRRDSLSDLLQDQWAGVEHCIESCVYHSTWAPFGISNPGVCIHHPGLNPYHYANPSTTTLHPHHEKIA